MQPGIKGKVRKTFPRTLKFGTAAFLMQLFLYDKNDKSGFYSKNL
jgi:hypothetical protein